MTDPEIIVRHADPRDFETCRGYDFPSATDDELRFKIARRELLLAERGGEVAGYLKLDWLGSHLPYLGLIVVEEPHRRRGVGRALLARLEEKLRGMGKTRLLSSSEAVEPEPQAWHRRVGFRDAGIILGANDDGGAEVFFMKAL